MNWKLPVFLSLVLGRLLVSSLALADESETQESGVYNLGEVVVRGKTAGVECLKATNGLQLNSEQQPVEPPFAVPIGISGKSS